MAKYTGSPWGEIRGKIGEAVGGTWKGINWVRLRVTPSNPRSEKQVKIRASFAQAFDVARAARTGLHVFFAKKENITSWNYISKLVTPQVYREGGPEEFTWSDLRFLPLGSGQPLSGVTCSYDKATGQVTASWDPAAQGDIDPNMKVTLYVLPRLTAFSHLIKDPNLIYPGWKSPSYPTRGVAKVYTGTATVGDGQVTVQLPPDMYDASDLAINLAVVYYDYTLQDCMEGYDECVATGMESGMSDDEIEKDCNPWWDQCLYGLASMVLHI